MLMKIGTEKSKLIELAQYKPTKFESTTTNNQTYKGFKMAGKPVIQTQKVEAMQSKALPTHFDTSNKKDYVAHKIRVSKLDLIPYP